MEERLYKVSEAAKRLGISRVTLRSWIRQGKIAAKRVGKLWMIPEGEIIRILGGGSPEGGRAVIYARVSSRKQEIDGDLERQVERLRLYASARGYKVVGVVTDVASGLNEDREGLERVMEMAKAKQFDILLVEFRDRLARFGFEYLRRYFEAFGVRVEAVEEGEEKSYMEELVEDFASIITSFAAEIYGKRSRKFQEVKRYVRNVIGEND
ncbi:IS607 family transposase [Infirmifilum lucidum]|uniref:IS607 family transposase n=1 Tax=Infirmifilum lucidum TaxID=2776706 RepID=A0A7L9FJ29_9CREN|nr:IS607 family transposase [Infirmifilum lucidum]QOJ78906.1 IS607 family transposase [Infirmifilum lucidum]